MATALDEAEERTREGEWFVPQAGPRRFRVIVGLSFYPYTLMNASYVIFGSMLFPGQIQWDRVGALVVVYLLAVGVAAHALDALAPNKPWGSVLTRKQLLTLVLLSLVPATGIGLYYSLLFAPYLLLIGLLEIFFLFAYNLEPMEGRFHTDYWFAFSWGLLPVFAGYVMQSNAVSPLALAGGTFGFITAFTEINASRPYKALKRLASLAPPETKKFENILKGLVASHLVLALSLVLFRAAS